MIKGIPRRNDASFRRERAWSNVLMGSHKPLGP